MSTENVSHKTFETVEAWRIAVSRLESAKSELNRAECSVLNAANNAGKWLTPDDAKEGEVFHIWISDGVLAVKVKDGSRNTFDLSWRKPMTKRP